MDSWICKSCKRHLQNLVRSASMYYMDDVFTSPIGIEIDSLTLADFKAALSSDSDSPHVTFGEFRDFLILLPRKASPKEIFRYYKVQRYLGDDGRGAARVNMEGMFASPLIQASTSIFFSQGTSASAPKINRLPQCPVLRVTIFHRTIAHMIGMKRTKTSTRTTKSWIHTFWKDIRH